MMKIQAAFSGFSVDDLARAKDFYTKTLGFELANENMGLQLKLPGGGEAFIYEKGDHQPATYTNLNLVVADIKQAVGEFQDKGISFERYENMPAPQDEQGILHGLAAGQGPDIAWFKDPAGNILSVMQVK